VPGNPRHHDQARVPFPPLNAAHISQVNLRLERKLLLCQPPLLTEAPDIPAQYRAPILHCRIGQHKKGAGGEQLGISNTYFATQSKTALAGSMRANFTAFPY
jgi:hypothetical protein